MKRKIKVQFLDFWKTFNIDTDPLVQALKVNYELDITDKNPDYVFFSCFGYENLKVSEKCIKVFFTGENCVPDFNICDYAIGFHYLDFGDRYLRWQEYDPRADKKHILPVDFDLHRDKPEFCSFVVTNGNGLPERVRVFNYLSGYKKVNSGGRFMNNIGGCLADKFAFNLRHKFSIAIENSSSPGYTTEKISDAFAARTIPIYYGDPLISRVFNSRAMVNIHEFPSFEDAMKRVIELDQNEELYLQTLKEPAFVSKEYEHEVQFSNLVTFLSGIIERPKEQSYRYNRRCYGDSYIKHELRRRIYEEKPIMMLCKDISQGICRKIIRCFSILKTMRTR